MSHKDWQNVERQGARRAKKLARDQEPNKLAVRSSLDWLLADSSIFSNLKLHGNTTWVPRGLVCFALLWALSSQRHVTDAFSEAVAWYRCMYGRPPCASYQAFMGVALRWTTPLMKILWPVLHGKMTLIGCRFWRINNWVPIAFDGSRDSAPRTISNEQEFCAKNYGKGKTAKYRRKKSKGMRRRNNERNKPQPQKPQIWITMLWHMGLRLPWMWRLGPSNSSERAHVMEMLEEGKFPGKTLFCGDAGFVGYPLWSAIMKRGHFLVRVGANVSLIAESAEFELLKNGICLCWPKDVRPQGDPLILRLVKVRIGKTDMYLLTSVLDAKELTVEQMIHFYRLRWGIEVEFRGLKQTLDRAKLRCRNSQRLYAELHWSLMIMTVIELFALKEQLAKHAKKSAANQRSYDPKKRSLAQAARAFRESLRDRDTVPEQGEDLFSLLASAMTDDYHRKASKKARYRPPNPDKKPLGKPKLRKMNRDERKRIKDLYANTQA